MREMPPPAPGLEDQGVRGVIRKLFDEASIREAVPDTIPYGLRDSFAALVGRALGAGGGRTGSDYFDQRQSQAFYSRLARRSEGLVYGVSLAPLPQAA